MSASTIKISQRARDILRELASQTGESMQAILEHALDEYSRHRFLEEANASYAALRADPKAWEEELQDRAMWDNTLADGLEDEA